MPKVIILGQAKSGTTALFHKLKDGMSENAMTVFEPKRDHFKTLVRQRSSSSLLVKSICARSQCKVDLSRFDKRVFILRDPRDQLISRLLYQTHAMADTHFEKSLLDPEYFAALIHQLKMKEQSPSEHSMFDIFPNIENACESLRHEHETVSMALAANDFFCIKYEDMIEGRMEELENYLGFSLQRETKVDAQFERVVRSKASGSWRHFLIPSDLPPLRDALLPYMTRHCYTDDWELATPQSIRPEECSQYVTKVVKLALRDLRQELDCRRRPEKSVVQIFVSAIRQVCGEFKTKLSRLPDTTSFVPQQKAQQQKA